MSTRKSRERNKGLTLILNKILQCIRHLTSAYPRRELLWLLLSQTSMGQTVAIWVLLLTSLIYVSLDSQSSAYIAKPPKSSF